ncbi:MAG TPA: alpha-2-macroglobulin family protein, partial [Anaerolineae bacterium]|nr:alpha-2-macroglobulin family protein [Anaerolineae bacterium]
ATNKLSDYKVGLLPLEVKPVAQKLSIALTPDREKAQPGEEVTYQVHATSSDGQPVSAEFSLDLVDKAVLSLLPRAPDAIVEAFYGKRSLGVNTSSDLAVSVNKFVEQLKQDLEAQPQARDAAVGQVIGGLGAGAENYAIAPSAAQPTPAAADGLALKDAAGLPQNITVREQFADTAYWNPRISTDANGNASVKIKLPDNLTTWTFRGVGLTSDTKVGEATVDLISTKPLLVRPVTPRFFTVGDKAELAANISNNTDTALDVIAILSSTGVTLNSDASQTINIAAHSEGKVTWNVEVLDVRSVQLAFIAQAGDLIDASKPRLATAPDGSLIVYRYTAPDIVGTAGQIKSAGGRTEIISLPPRFDVTKGEVSIQIDPSLAAGMINGLDYLEHYQYECTEQTVSRFLPNVLTYRALKDLGIDNKTLGDKLPSLVSEGLDRLYAGQHNDGGWGWWIDDQSSPHLTAYVVFGLIQARDAGFDVKADAIDRGEQYLIQNLGSPARDFLNWDANRQAWFLYVLSTDDRAPTNSIDDLFGERDKLSYYARAHLVMAIGQQNKEDARIQTILSDLNNAAIVSATGAHWEEDSSDWWSMNTDTRSTAIILDAYAQLDKNNALAPNIVRWLMVARKIGYWETTQETAWALIGLTDWMRAKGELKPNYDYALFLNDKSISEGHLSPAQVQDPIKLQIAVKDLIADVGNKLRFSRGDGAGVLYYTAHLKVYQPVEDLKPANRGVIVSRRYSLASCTETDRSKCPDVREVKLGDVIRVDLTIVASNDLYYLVVEDPLPAGAEAVDTGLATTSMLAQGVS